MAGFNAIVLRDLRLALRANGEALALVVFFVLVGVVIPFAVGPDRVLLARLAPAIVWVAAFLAMLIGIERLFRADHEDGTLLVLRLSGTGLVTAVAAKWLVHWLLTAVPLIAATPVLAVLLGLDIPGWLLLVAALALGTPGLAALATLAAALTVSLRRGGLVAPVIVMPLALPILIFGVGASAPTAGQSATAALLLLAAASLVLIAITPFGAALALAAAED
jgi:heme exporter protein B